MDPLASAIADYLASQVGRRVNESRGRLQLVFSGAPTPVLEAVFNALTDFGAHDWPLPGVDDPVVVLLVGGSVQGTEPHGPVRSARTNWDYAVTMRHAYPLSLILATNTAIETLPESIENASERLGALDSSTARSRMRSEPWPHLIQRISTLAHQLPADTAKGLRHLVEDCLSEERERHELLPWQAVNDLLSGRPFPEAVGLPNLDSTGVAPARAILEKLAKACADQGFAEVEQRFVNARNDVRDTNDQFIPDSRAIPSLFAHLRETAGSGAAFARAPALYFRGTSQDQPWREQLSREVLAELLEASNISTSSGTLVLRVSSMVSDLGSGEPFVVRDEVRLAVTARNGDPVQTATFIRKVPGANREWSDVTGGDLIDNDLPDHSKPISYKATVPEFRAKSVNVIALNTFAARGHAHIEGALKNPPPSQQTAGSGVKQALSIRQAGVHRLHLFVADSVTHVQLAINGTDPGRQNVQDNHAAFPIHVEPSTGVNVQLFDGTGKVVSAWDIDFLVEEVDRTVTHSQFESLVLSHLEGARSRVVLSMASQARELETQIMESPSSYKSVVACWFPHGLSAGPINWDSGTAGEVPVTLEPRPPQAMHEPPEDYLQARREIFDYLADNHPEQPICEIRLTDQALHQSVTNYLNTYIQWLASDPEGAMWAESIALFVKAEVGVSPEPVMLLLTPFHPLRIAWHVNAQSLLFEGLAKTCPLAGLLSPSAVPGIGALPIWYGQQVQWRSFLGVPCNDPHWAVMVNGNYLQNSDLTKRAFEVLRRLGLTTEGLVGGMTSSQAKRALDDVSGILAARSTLRVGLVGSSHEGTSAVHGALDWVRRKFEGSDSSEMTQVTGGDLFREPPVYPSAIELYDYRASAFGPAEAEVANLSDEIGSGFRWFVGHADEPPSLDLILFNQSGTPHATVVAPEWTGASHAAIAAGAAFKVNIREDESNGRRIAEARIADLRLGGATLPAALVQGVANYEGFSKRAHATHLEFVPDQQQLDHWMSKGRFVAASSLQLDPACFIRGASEHGDYLWDYELPALTRLDSGATGYYLITRPRSSMHEAVRRSLSVISPTPPPVEPLLAEISKRGIPVLKRLASGGARAKGELGVLLALRLLQDAFRTPNSGIRLPVLHGDCINMVLAVDPYEGPLASINRALGVTDSLRRPDLLVFSVHCEADSCAIKITPVEVKFQTAQNRGVLVEAVEQANSFTKAFHALWCSTPPNELWDLCGRALLARCLDECFRVYADPAVHQADVRRWSELHEKVIQSVLGVPRLSGIVSVTKGRVLAFGPGFTETRLASMDADEFRETLMVNVADCRELLTETGSPSTVATTAVQSLDFTVADCAENDGSQPRGHDASIVGPSDDSGNGDQPDDFDDMLEEAEAESHLGIPAELRMRVAEAFSGFVGNARPVRRLTRDLLIALGADSPCLARNYLFVGPPSVGKTELAKRVAHALGLPLVQLDGTALRDREHLFSLIDSQLGHRVCAVQNDSSSAEGVLRYPPFVVFVDEAHLISRKVQESLLTMLETSDRSVRLRSGIARVDRATFLLATTQASKLDKALRSRCVEIQLRPYSLSEVAHMIRGFVRGRAPSPSEWDEEVYAKIAALGRLVPRRSFEIANELINELKTTEHPEWTTSTHLRVVQDMMELDDNGLGPLDVEYLTVLDRAGRPLGEEAVSTALSTIDRVTVVEDIEPYLRRLGLLSLGVRGRELTSLGQEYLARYKASH